MLSRTLDDLIDASKELSAGDRRKLIGAVTASLDESQAHAVATTTAVSLDDLVGLRRTPSVGDLDTFIADFWPEDEDADAVIDFIYQQRQTERAADS